MIGFPVIVLRLAVLWLVVAASRIRVRWNVVISDVRVPASNAMRFILRSTIAVRMRIAVPGITMEFSVMATAPVRPVVMTPAR